MSILVTFGGQNYTIPEPGDAFTQSLTDLLKALSTNTPTFTTITATAAGSSLAAEAWNAPTLAGTWANYGTPYSVAGYYKDAVGVVHLKGTVKAGTGTIFTLPVGYRPLETHVFAVNGSDAFAEVIVSSSGTVGLNFGSATTSLTLNGITFRAEQ